MWLLTRLWTSLISSFQLKQGLGLVTLTLLLSFSLSTAASTFVAEKDRAELRQHLKLAIAQADSFDDRFDAEVWLLDMSGRLTRFMPEPQQRLEFLRLVHREARAAKLDPELVLALIEVESNFDRFAVSSAGAQGLMQVMPFWKAEIGRSDDNLSKVETNLRYGCQILQFYINKEKGGLFRALARYNGSLGKSWYPERVLSRWRKRWYAGEIEGL